MNDTASTPNQSELSVSPSATTVQHSPVSPTSATYPELDKIYKEFNDHFFDGKLPAVMITLQRKSPKVAGFYSPKRFISTKNSFSDELALNPTLLRTDGVVEGLQTLLHEMVHVWQDHFGKPPRRGYHDHQFAEKMKEVGLMPSSTGQPGGKQVGQKMSDYVIEGGPFDILSRRMIANGFYFPWAELTQAEIDQQSHEDQLAKAVQANEVLLAESPKLPFILLEPDDLDSGAFEEVITEAVDKLLVPGAAPQSNADDSDEWSPSPDAMEPEEDSLENETSSKPKPAPVITHNDLYEAFPDEPQDGKLYVFPVHIPEDFVLPPGYKPHELPCHMTGAVSAVSFSKELHAEHLREGHTEPPVSPKNHVLPLNAVVTGNDKEILIKGSTTKTKSPGRIAFICPCKHRIWGKPSTHAFCGFCKNPYLPSTVE